ncbi:MAG: AtpZ/AtpI family protein [Patescibacteria group bacterium]
MTQDPSTKISQKDKPVDNGLTVWQAFGFAWEMGYTMAIPLVLLALGGRMLDRYLESSPVFLLIGILLSIIASSILVGMKATKIINKVSQK